MQNTTSNHQWEWYTSGSVGNDGIGLYDRTNSSYRIAINDDGNLGLGTTAPTTKFHVYDNTNITPSTSADGAFRIQGSSTSLTMGQNTNYNWIQTWSSKPLAINPIGNNVGVGTASPSEKLNVNGNIKVDNGHLNVGGTSTSTTRYGVKEIYRDETWTIEDEYQAVRMYEDPSGNFASIERPTGASSFTIYRVEYDVTGLTTDADEEQWFKLQVGGSTCDSQASTGVAWGSNCGGGNAFGRTSPMADYGWIGDDNAAFNINETVETNETFTDSSYDLFLYGADENAGAGQVETSSIRVKIYYSYSVSAQDGDIVAGGRIYANSTQSVGDVAEYFPINEGVEIGHIIASEPGKSNYYKLADDPYCNHLVGVISNEPSVVLNDPSVGPPVGLTGRVNVKLVDSENLIKSGDFITSSNQKGLGQIACKEGPVIGYAVRNQKLGEDFVEILLQPGRYYKPSKRTGEQTIKAELKANYSELENRLKELENIIQQLTIKE